MAEQTVTNAVTDAAKSSSTNNVPGGDRYDKRHVVTGPESDSSVVTEGGSSSNALPLPGVQLPGAHEMATNKEGKVIHRFRMQAVVTNMPAMTNALATAEERQTVLSKEIQQLLLDEMPIRRALMDERKAMMNVATNFVPQDEEGKRLMEQMAAAEKALKDLRAQYVKKLAADPAYAKAKANMDANQEALKALQSRKAKLREEVNRLGVEIKQLKALETGAKVAEQGGGDKPQAGAQR